MKAERMATRMSVLGRALPSRVLLVDDDELELELMADRLAAAGFEVRRIGLLPRPTPLKSIKSPRPRWKNAARRDSAIAAKTRSPRVSMSSVAMMSLFI